MTPATVNLKELADILGVKLTTLYGDWPERVRRGAIPGTLRGFKRPTWSRTELTARLDNTEPAPAEKKVRKPSGTPGATSRLLLMRRA